VKLTFGEIDIFGGKMNEEVYGRKKLIHILCVFFIIIGILSVVSEVNSANIYVNPSTGSDSNIGDVNNPKATIKNATGSANNNDVIILANGTYTGVGNTNINIVKNLSYIGSNNKQVILNAGGKGNFFTVNSGYSVLFNNITFMNGLSVQGGAIFSEGSLTVKNSIFINNTGNVVSGGGAIHNYGTFLIDNCVFEGNYAGYGGAFYNDVGNNGVINNSNFTNNGAYQHGGAIDNVVGNNTIIANSIFKNNWVNLTSGGAIYIHNNNIFNIINVSFINNTATTNGGAIFNYGNNTRIYKSSFINNSAKLGGGAIYSYQNTNFTVDNSSLINNKAGTDYGGAIFNNAGININLNNS
jgi:predicted outer membrane repeat protein